MGYAVLIGFNYYMELTLVRNNLYTVEFAMDEPQSIMWVIDAWIWFYGDGYSCYFLCIYKRETGKCNPLAIYCQWYFRYWGNDWLCTWIKLEHFGWRFGHLGYCDANIKYIVGYSIQKGFKDDQLLHPADAV